MKFRKLPGGSAQAAAEKSAGIGQRISELASSLPGDATSAGTPVAKEIDLDLLDPNPFQPRKLFDPAEINSLARGLAEVGQLQPIRYAPQRPDVPLIGRDGQPVHQVAGRFWIIAGERRVRAARQLGRTKIVGMEFAGDIARAAIVENLQRENLHPIEEAMGLQVWMDVEKISRAEAARRIGVDPAEITRLMRLVKLPQAIVDEILVDKATAERVARNTLFAMAALDTDKQLEVWPRLKAGEWGLVQLQAAIERMKAGKDETPPVTTAPVLKNPAAKAGEAMQQKWSRWLEKTAEKPLASEDRKELAALETTLQRILGELRDQLQR